MLDFEAFLKALVRITIVAQETLKDGALTPEDLLKKKLEEHKKKSEDKNLLK